MSLYMDVIYDAKEFERNSNEIIAISGHNNEFHVIWKDGEKTVYVNPVKDFEIEILRIWEKLCAGS